MAEALLQRLTKKERRQAALQFHQQRQQAGEAKQDEALQNRWSSRLRKVRNRITSICQVREGNGVSPPPGGGGGGLFFVPQPANTNFKGGSKCDSFSGHQLVSLVHL